MTEPGPVAAGPVPVVLIAGAGRSGSTLLANVLGEIPGWRSLGEVRYFWERGLVESRLCGCGEPVRDCPFWSAVIAADPDLATDPRAAMRLQNATARIRHVPALALPAPLRHRLLDDLDDQVALLDRLWRAIAATTGPGVVVDSSKLPTYGYALARVPSVDLKVVHLVRNPAAAAYSWQSSKALTDGAAKAEMERRGVAKSLGLWSFWNVVTERLWAGDESAYVRVRYEDLVSDPSAAVDRITTTLDLPGRGDDVITEVDGRPAVDLGVHHTVAGNPDRLRRGPTPISADERWRTGLDRRTQRLVATVSAPVARRYGY